jgi:hypothetical protein
MAGMAGSGDRACGHPAYPGARFCPVCGQPANGSAAPSQPLTAPLPAVPAPPYATFPPSASPAAAPPPQPEPAPWDSWYAPRRPPPAPSGPQPWPAPPGGMQPPSADPDATRVDGLGPVPSGDPYTAMLGDLRLAPASGGPRRPGGRLVPVIVAAVLVAVVAGVVIFRALSGSTATGGTGSTPSASSQDARRQAAVRLSGLLAQSVTDRAAVTHAAEDVRGCGPSLPQDARTFARAASSRQQLLSRLASMPGRSVLPAAMLQDLTGAWQASAQVDTDLARWAQGKIDRGCHPDSPPDARLRASYVPEARAAVGKRAFASLWNPLARQYGLTTYQRDQL